MIRLESECMFDPHFLCGRLINSMYSVAGPSPPSPLPSSLDSRIWTLFFSFLFLGLLDTDHFSYYFSISSSKQWTL